MVLAWERELNADLDKVNPNGGAIALGHPLGGTGAFLITKALHELERTDGTQRASSRCAAAAASARARSSSASEAAGEGGARSSTRRPSDDLPVLAGVA